jgi:crotonobetainyl-CoA:carnitine CoA-transferase CaiB-like acyl-CoA transferase
VLGSGADGAAIAAAVAERDSAELEAALAQARMCGVIARRAEEWRAHPQGAALAAGPLVEIEKVADTPPVPLPPAASPLAGIRVADFTRILAGPIASRFLAAAGADVLSLAAPHLPDIPAYALETSHGKRSAWLDLRDPAQAAQARDLVGAADMVVDSYRPGALDRHRLGPATLAARPRGAIHVSINCYGWSGPWVERPGWELMGQTATGLAIGHGGAATPAPLWTYPCDYLTGYLGGLGAIVALARRTREGGSYHVRVSLCRTGMYAAGFGVRYATIPAARALDTRVLRCAATAQGRLQYLPVPLAIDGCDLGWQRFAARKGSDAARWDG